MLIGGAYLQVDNHPQPVLRPRLGRLNAFDSVANYVKRGAQVRRGLIFLQSQSPLRLQGFELLNRRLGCIGPIQQLPPGDSAFG